MKTKDIFVKAKYANVFMLSIFAFQLFWTTQHLFLNDVNPGNISFLTVILIFLASILIPIAYIARTRLNVFFSVLWIAVYSAYIFTFLNIKVSDYYTYSQVFLVPLTIASAAIARRANDKAQAAYKIHQKQISKYVNNIDSFTGLLNTTALVTKLYNLKAAKENHPNYIFYIFGIKIPFYNEFIDLVGHEEYVNYLNDVVSDLSDILNLNNFYAIDQSLIVTNINYLNKEQMELLNNDIKAIFTEHLPTKRAFNHRMYVQSGYIHCDEIEKRNLYELDALRKDILKKTEVDIHGEYY